MLSDATLRFYQQNLLCTPDELAALPCTDRSRRRLLRLREVFFIWTANPRWTEAEVARFLFEKFGIGKSVAYEDIAIVKCCIGAVNRTTRDYDRYLFRQRCEEGWAMARKQGDLKAFAAITAAYVRGTGLDKEEAALPDYALIQPEPFTITDNPEDSGYKRQPGLLEKARKLEEQYKRETEAQ